MKKIKFLFFALMSFSLTTYSNVNYTVSPGLSAVEITPDENKPYLIKEFTLNQVGNLKVKTSGGNIHVLGTGGNTVKVEMYVRPSNGNNKSSSRIEKALNNYNINISKENNSVSVLVESKGWSWSSKNNLSISFTVYVPYEISSDLNTTGGSIHISDIKGFQKVYTTGGSITCKAVDGNIKANTSGGSIHVENYDGELDASTSGGSIKLKNANGNLKIHTSGGGISLHDVSGSINAETSGGGITATIKKLENALTLITTGGSINATVPSGQGVDLDLKGNKVYTELVNFNGKTERDKIVGSMNGGGIPIKLSTTGGNVNLNFRN